MFYQSNVKAGLSSLLASSHHLLWHHFFETSCYHIHATAMAQPRQLIFKIKYKENKL